MRRGMSSRMISIKVNFILALKRRIMADGRNNIEMATRRSFVDFAEGLLNMDPIKRWSPQQALKHPFITGEKWIGPWQVRRLYCLSIYSWH